MRTTSLLLLLLVTAALLARSSEMAAALPVSDSVEYAVSAARLVAGEGLTVAVDGVAHPPRYPPGFPVLFVAPWAWLFDGDLGAGVYAVWLSALVVLWCLGRLLADASDEAGLVAAWLALCLVLQVHFFRRNAQEVLADMPLLASSLVALEVYRRRPVVGHGALLLGGVATAVALSMRLTSLALALPFLLALLRSPRRSRPLPWLCLGLPIVCVVVVLVVHAQVTFGSPFATGYAYWLEPEAYLPRFDRIGRNALEMLHPFEPYHARRSLLASGLGPLALVAVAALGALCARHRRHTWQRTRPALVFLLAGFGPVALFHLVYPFASSRFFLLPHVVLLSLGAVWGLDLLGQRARRVVAVGAAGWLLALLLVRAGVSPLDEGAAALGDLAEARPYVLEFAEQADPVVPDDGVLIGGFNAAWIEHVFVRGTGRRYVPLSLRGEYAKRRVGPPGAARRPVCPLVAAEDPAAVRALLRAGRRVFLEALYTSATRRRGSLEEFVALFEARVVLSQGGQPVLYELFAR